MTRARLHHCDKCNERSSVWKRTAMGKFFEYCTNKGCPSNRKEVSPSEKIVLDKSETSSIIGTHTPQNDGMNSKSGTIGKSGTTQMTYKDAEILIAEGRKLGYRGTDWEQSFLQRLEAMQPVFLLPADSAAVEEFYRRATGGGFRTNKRSLARMPAESEF